MAIQPHPIAPQESKDLTSPWLPVMRQQFDECQSPGRLKLLPTWTQSIATTESDWSTAIARCSYVEQGEAIGGWSRRIAFGNRSSVVASPDSLTRCYGRLGLRLITDAPARTGRRLPLRHRSVVVWPLERVLVLVPASHLKRLAFTFFDRQA